MAYTTYDFEETLAQGGGVDDVLAVEAAWGNTKPGCCFECGGEWSGGFLLKTADGWRYLTGWCDYTGWGCQDGVERYDFAARPTFGQLEGDEQPEWDEAPADLNNCLAALKRGETVNG